MNRASFQYLPSGAATLALLAITCSRSVAADGPVPAPAGLTEYKIGTPSGDEVEMLELVNRSRANPPAEGQRLAAAIIPANYGIGTGGSVELANEYWATVNELKTSFATYPARPPVAFNAALNAAAQAHVADMIATGVQQHNSSDGTSAEARVASFGYPTFTGENVEGEPYYNPPWIVTPYGSEGEYEIDASNAHPGYGHRYNIMEPDFPGHVEVGIAQRALGGWNTEDFGDRGTPTLLTGVVFTDNAGSGFYASGEGVRGVTVTAPGFSSYYAVTGAGGAYTLPLDLVGPVYAWGYSYTYDPSTQKYLYSPVNPAPAVSVTFTDAQGNAVTRVLTLTYTEMQNPDMVDPTTGFTGVIPTFSDGDGTPRWDNVKADWVLPASVTPTPTPAPAPTQHADVTITPAADGKGFVVARSGDTTSTLMVTYKAQGTAAAGKDYVPLSGTKKIKAGKQQARINVTVLSGATGSLKLKLVGNADAYAVGSPNKAKVYLSDIP